MAGYVFIMNSTKPTENQRKSRDFVKMSNVERPCIEVALNMGYKVYLGYNRDNPEELKCGLPIKMYDSHTYRSIFDFNSNIIAYNNLMNVLSKGDIEVIHCNTPVGGMIGRICGKKARIKKVIYTAHGFHFYKGAPLANNIIFKFAEKIMARWTDVIITMNEEDYNSAKKLKLKKNGKVYKVHGVGINLDDYANVSVNKSDIRKSINLSDDDFVCISAGDLIKRKDYKTAINAIAELKNDRVKLIICGVGPEREHLDKLAVKLNVEKQIVFLGYRTDMKELFKCADCFLFTSLQEGLPRALMEAMASGLPCIVSKIRGNVDLIDDEKGGILCKPQNIKNFATAINTLYVDKNIRESFSKYNLEIIKKYDVTNVKKEIEKIYKESL